MVDNNVETGSTILGVNFLQTGVDNTGPAEKRDLALADATGDIIAFLDDDSYPRLDWIANALEHFKRADLAGVCGPGLTPPDNSFKQQLSGAILASSFGAGNYSYRFKPSSPRYVDDFPTYNLFVRRSVLEKVGGFGSMFYGGEDTLLCAKIAAEFGPRSILYVPDVVVYHHRRRWPVHHLRQVSNYGLHRAYFARKHRKTSRRISYFLPLIAMLIGVVLVVAAIANPLARMALIAISAIIYSAIAAGSLLARDRPLIALILPLAVISSHLAYAVAFLRGLLVRELTR